MRSVLNGERFEVQALRQDGSEFPLAKFRSAMCPGRSRRFSRGFVRDISGPKRVEAELRAAMHDGGDGGACDRGIDRAFSSARGSGFAPGLDGAIEWRTRLRKPGMPGLLRGEIGRGGARERLGAIRASGRFAECLRALAGIARLGQTYEVEFRLRRFDQEYRWFLVRSQAMRDDEGAITRWFGTNTDIHDLKTAQGDAEHASRAKDDFWPRFRTNCARRSRRS